MDLVSTGVAMVLVLIVGAGLAGWWAGRRALRRPAAGGVGTGESSSAQRAALARAWQEGYDAGSGTSARTFPVTVPAAAPAAGAPAAPESQGTAGFAGGPATALLGHPSGPSANIHTGPPETEPEVAPGVPPLGPPRGSWEPRPREHDPERRALRNINITLYVAAMLLVAAASLFIGISFPAGAKFAGLALLTAGFYAGGLVVHAGSDRLRPAATAFTGTGLALIPVTGLAFYLLVSGNAATTLLTTSVVGTAAFVYAAARLQSRVLAALSLTFLVSTAWSGGAVLNRGLVWYFMFTMLLAAAATAVAYARPRWLTNIYVRAFTTAHRYVVPATLAVALLLPGVLRTRDYLLLTLAATAYYAAVSFAGPARERLANMYAGRAGAVAATAYLTAELGADTTGVARTVAVLLLFQGLAVVLYRGHYTRLLSAEPRPGWTRPGWTRAGWIRAEALLLFAAGMLFALAGNERGLADAASDPVWWSFNWTLLVAVALGVVAGARGGVSFLWVPLVAGAAVLLEPWDPLPWRQSLVLSLALALTVGAVARVQDRAEARTLTTQAQNVVVRVLLPVALASVAASAAWAWAWASVSTGRVGVADGELRWWWTAFGVAWLAGSVAAAFRLRAARTRAPFVEAALLSVGVAAAFVAVVMLAPGPQGMLLGTVVAVALVSATLVLGVRGRVAPARHGGTGRGWVRGSGHAVGALGLAGAVALSGGFRTEWALEAVFAAGLAYCCVRAGSPGRPWDRGAYAAAGQLFLTFCALHIADRFDADIHATVAIATVTLAAGQVARLQLTGGSGSRGGGARGAGEQGAEALGAGARGRGRFGGGAARGIGLNKVMGWSAFGVLLLTPFAYWLGTGSWGGGVFGRLVGGGSGADRASLLVQLLCLGVFGVFWWLRGATPRTAVAHRWTVLAVPVAAAGIAVVPSANTGMRVGGWLPADLWGPQVAIALLVAMGAAAIVHEGRDRGGSYRWQRAAAAAGFLATALAVAPTEPGWRAATLFAVAAGFAVFAHTSGAAWLLLGTAAALPAALNAGTLQVLWLPDNGSVTDEALAMSAALVAAGLFLYATRWAWSGGHARYAALGGLADVVLGGALAQGEPFPLDVIGLALISAAAVAAVFEAPAGRRVAPAEAAFLLVAACAQRSWWIVDGPLGYFWVAQYWVVVLALVAGYHFAVRDAGRGRRGTAYLCVAAAVLTATGPTTLFADGFAEQAWTICGHAALLAFGLLSNRRLFVVWGAVGVGLAVLWYLRGFTFLLLLFVALALIATAVWRLTRIGRAAP